VRWRVEVARSQEIVDFFVLACRGGLALPSIAISGSAMSLSGPAFHFNILGLI